MTQLRRTAAVVSLLMGSAATAGRAQQPAPPPASPRPFSVGNPLGNPVLPAADGAFKPISPNVKVYGSVYSAESCSYDPVRGLIVVPNRGVPQSVRANDAWITLLNHDGSVHTARWIGVQSAGSQRDSISPPLVLNEPFGSDIVDGVLYLADRDGDTGPNDPLVSVIRRFDLKTGAPLAVTRVPEASWFNDIAVARDGTVYGTITGGGQVWRVLPNGQAAIFAQGEPLSRPNGVALDREGNVVVVNMGNTAVLTFSREGSLVRTEQAVQSGSDGIVIMGDGTKYVSSVVLGGVSRIRPGQAPELIAENIPSAASMCHDPGAGQLVIPMNANNALAFIKIPSEQAQPATPPEPLPLGQTNNPFPQPIASTEGVITVTLREFASLPDIDGVAARMMTLVDEPKTRRLFVSEMRGLLYVVTPDGKTVTPYLDLRDAKWALAVQSQGRERGLQSFTLHPQFAQAGTPGFGKLYTFIDVSNQTPAPDFRAPRDSTTHDTVLLEWTAKTPGAAGYDGEAPREMLRLRQPFANHNGGAIAFNPTARPGSADFGLLYVSIADGGSGGDPMRQAQNLGSAFGKIFRIDPLGKNGRGGKYGIPAANPFVSKSDALPEIFAYGIRNAQRLGWDSRNGSMYLSDIGQNIVEEVSPVSAGADLGWNVWEGSYRFVSRRAVITDSARSDPKVTYPIVEWDQLDPVLLPSNQAASVGVVVYRGTAVPQLTGRLLFGDMPAGELFHVSADQLPKGGQDAIRRVLFVTVPGSAPRKFLQIIQEKNTAQGKPAATRADLRFDLTSAGQIFVLNKGDGTIRVIER